MKRQGAGNETRYDGPEHKIESERKGAPGVGVFMSYKRWCMKCRQDKPAAGAKQIMPGVFKCSDCQISATTKATP